MVPILAIDQANNIKHFLGTGTFVGKKPWLVTAEHVVRNWNELFAIVIISNPSNIIRANLVARNRNSDLALLEVPSYPSERAVQVAQDNEIMHNYSVVSCEYGTTQTKGKYLYFSPATRLGNVTRMVDLRDSYGEAGQDMLELSFPALRGASGSPVLSNDNFHLWGVVIANRSYHLLPAQIESVLDEKNQLIEETKYLLPQALAVHVRHVRTLIDAHESK